MHNNRIADLGPLENSILSDGDALYIDCNPLSDDARLVDLPELEARGVSIQMISFEDYCDIVRRWEAGCFGSGNGGAFRSAPYSQWMGDALLVLLALFTLMVYRPRRN